MVKYDKWCKMTNSDDHTVVTDDYYYYSTEKL